MKSKIIKIQKILTKGILNILVLAMLLPTSILAVEGLTLQESTALEILMYGQVGSVVRKIEEYFKSNTTLYIAYETQLRALAEYVNNGHDCLGKEIILLNDIELSQENWIPIGTKEEQFAGTFNGNGHTISNLHCEDEDGIFLGLFGVLDSEGRIKNLNVRDFSFKVGDFRYSNYPKFVGSIVGFGFGIINNCTAEGINIESGSVIIGDDKDREDEASYEYIDVNYEANKEDYDNPKTNWIYVGKMAGGLRTGNEINAPDILVSQVPQGPEGIDVKISILKSDETEYKEISEFYNTIYLKKDEKLKVELTFDKYLYGGLDAGNAIKVIEDKEDFQYFPRLTFKENIYLQPIDGIDAAQEKDKQESEKILKEGELTKLVYEYTVDGEPLTVKNINIDYKKNKDNKNIYLYYSTDEEEFNTENLFEKNGSITNLNIELDGSAPSINSSASVADFSEASRYSEGKEIIVKLTTNEKIQATLAPEININFTESGLGKYNYQDDNSTGNAKHIDAIIDSAGYTTWTYSYIIQPGDEGYLQYNFISGTISDLSNNTTILKNINGGGFSTFRGIYADTTNPTVQIRNINKIKCSAYDFDNDGYTSDADYKYLELYIAGFLEDEAIRSNIENNAKVIEDEKINLMDILLMKKLFNTVITYEFVWSEQVEGFRLEDITVNNGTIDGTLSEVIENDDGTYSYIMNIIPSIGNGAVGDVQVIVEQNACQDLVGHGNVRAESTIIVDKKAPTLKSLEAYANSHIGLNSQVDVVKEYYKTGDNISVVATFDENIEGATAPILTLQFSESGNAKGSVSAGTIAGNKITYTYKITDKDKGTLSVRAFSGTVLDVAGNETEVVRKVLDSNTIIADTDAPTLVEITAIAPNFEYDELLQGEDKKRYGVENTITIIAEYSENVYNLSSNTINKITDNTDPVLKIKFGTGTTRTAKYYKTEGSKIYYTYNIDSGDNGDLSIVSLSGTVSDIAGNICTTNISSPTLVKYEESIAEENEVNNITADTTNPTFTITATAENYDDNKNVISGNGSYYRKGSVITVTAKTNEYVYKNNNKELTRFAENGSDAPQLNIGFGTSGNGVGTCTSVEYTNNQTIFTYTYEVKENDNGTLNLNIGALRGYDIALNGNDAKTEPISTIVSDTVRPYYADQPGIEYVNGGYKVTFNENLYYLSKNNVVTSFGDINQAPLLKFEGQETEYNPSISDNVITYAGNYINAKPYLGASRLCDKAGNLYAYYDQEAPELLNNTLVVTSPETRTYKAGQEITIVATFSEKVTGTAPTLQLQFSKSGDAKGNVSTGVIEENTITYKYSITATDAVGNGDNGVLSIKSFTGTGLKDLSDNLWVAPTSVTLTGNEITADTIAPTVTITSNVERTNKDIVKYTFTWSETVTDFDEDDIELINGLKGNFKAVPNTNGKVYTLEVETIEEGRQIVKVNAGVCVDVAGNENNQRFTYNKVLIDYTKPVIRAKVNGGSYVMDTTDPENKKAMIAETLVVNEELSELKYAWSTETDIEKVPEIAWITEDVEAIFVNSDITLNKELKETGTYYLYMKATDLAGNILNARTKAFVVSNSKITLTPDITDITNKDVTVSVEYGEGLTENRKAGVSGKTQSADASKVIITENGTVYAEATDKAGNKVCKVLEIENIDKIAPEGTITYVTNEDKSVTATISFNEKNVTITNNSGKNDYTFEENGEFTFEFKDKAGNTGTAKAVVTSIKDNTEPEEPPIEEDKTAPTITFNYTTTTATVGTPIGATISTDEDAIISYSWDNKTWTTSQDYVRTQSVNRTPSAAGTYILYAKAVDKSSNQSTVQKLEFTVVNSEEDIKRPEIIFEDLPTMQVNGVKYVKVSSEMTTGNLTNKMDKNALCDATPKYTKLTSDNKLRTSSEITINGETKYVIIVNGDVNCDGKVSFLGDIVMINNYRIGLNKNLSTIQILAADVNNSGEIEFIPDIVAMNNYRLGRINSL